MIEANFSTGGKIDFCKLQLCRRVPGKKRRTGRLRDRCHGRIFNKINGVLSTSMNFQKKNREQVVVIVCL